MKKIIVVLVAFATVMTACKETKKEKTVAVQEAEKATVKVADLNNVDTKASVLTWKGTKPTGEHHGTVLLSDGDLLVEDGKIIGGEFAIDMNSMVCKDLQGEYAAKLVGHLKSADFFDVATFPSSTFIITNVADKGDAIHVTGNLTLKDVTKSITIPATVSSVDGVTTFESEKFVINRADFNVKYGSKSFFDNLKDKFIDDTIELSFTIKTKA